jgi:hypothetical protein
MAIAVLWRLATAAPAPLFAAIGRPAAGRAWAVFSVSGPLEQVAGPRYVVLLLIPGAVRPAVAMTAADLRVGFVEAPA